MTSMVFHYSVELEDGRKFDTVSDQRDVAKWELEPFGCAFMTGLQERTVSLSRYLAWSSSKRDGQHKLTWAAWCDKAKEVTATGSADEVEPVDPGNPAASAE
jgi:hypothetical protein